MRTPLRWTVACVAGGALTILAGTPAWAAATPAPSNPHFRVINQVSDQTGKARIADSDLVNPWGLAMSPTGPLWVANNGTNTATIYPGGLNGASVTKAGLTVTIPGGAPTGQAFNSTTDFPVMVGTSSAPATFLFVSEGGQVTAWSSTLSGTNASIVGHHTGASYKGLAVVHTHSANYLLATDFHGGRVDVYDSSFHLVQPDTLDLRDPTLPDGYAPFNVMAVGDTVYVTYAKQDAAKADEVAGPGRGFVDAYTVSGAHPVRHRTASRGTLNAPWGMAIAPANFGPFAGALLVGNFGDGRIFAFRGGQFLGALRYPNFHRVRIEGLWALLPGTAASGGVGTLWFSAGPDDESHGLVGQIVLAS
jgi:uncharacterized protein (TIGR03118 family)